MDDSLLNGAEDWSACVIGFNLSGLQWGDTAAPRTAICLHGWMDNAMSFSALAPYIANMGIYVLVCVISCVIMQHDAVFYVPAVINQLFRISRGGVGHAGSRAVAAHSCFLRQLLC